MILSRKIRIIPTKSQEEKLWKSVGTARYIYNWTLDKQIKHFESTRKLNKISDNDLRKEITILKKSELLWLNEVSNNVAKQSIKDCCKAIDRFYKESNKHGYKYRNSALKSGKVLNFRDFEDFPRFKSRKYSKKSFYNDTSKLLVKENLVLIEKVGWIKTVEQIPVNTKYTNPRVSFDNKYWYISVGIEKSENNTDLTGESIGIDLGIKSLAVCSNIGKPFKNINKTKEIKRLKKKLKRNQRKVSRKYENNKIQNGKVGENRYKFTKTNNIIKLENQVKLIQRRLKNIRLNHIHQATSLIVKTKPSKIVMEDLNVKSMMKNKHLSKAISEQKFYEFIRIMKYKSEFNGIEFIQADRFYPSSKTCSNCGSIKKDLKLKDRVYVCPHCGLTIDRDKNASINLSRYKISKVS